MLSRIRNAFPSSAPERETTDGLPPGPPVLEKWGESPVQFSTSSAALSGTTLMTKATAAAAAAAATANLRPVRDVRMFIGLLRG
ncbi:hypothetical protein [Streptomyces sp. NPDC059850]|uniref:hypothetical protein n=1 Tax=Streptomyces sp. NPDC059850 TaxID=3346970 RepID=UPI00365F0C1A